MRRFHKAIALILIPCLNITSSPKSANSLTSRLEGKCGLVESQRSFQRCLLINDQNQITVLIGANQNLLLQAKDSQLVWAGSVGELINKSDNSRYIENLLSQLNTSLSDAETASNARFAQTESQSKTVTLIFIADRSSSTINQLYSALPNKQKIASSPQSSVAPSEASQLIENFNKEFERCYGLYQYTMFDEADRVLDSLITSAKLFTREYGGYQGASEITTAFIKRINQLQQYRSIQLFTRQTEEQEAEARFNQAQRARWAAEQRRLEQAYRFAVEARKKAEADALRWWSFWNSRPVNNIVIFR